MKSLKLTILIFLCALSFKLPAAVLPFRLGDILTAEISRHKLSIKNLGEYDFDFKFKHNAYAVVVFKLLKGRTISIYDFKLKFEGKLYKCVALRTGNGPFDAKQWQISKSNPDTIYSMLFVLNSEVFGNAKKKVSAELVYNLNQSGQVYLKLPFEFLNYDELTSFADIPRKGVFPELKIDTEKKPAEKSSK